MEELNLRDYLRVMWVRKWVILGVFLVAIVAAGLYSSSLANVYEATAQVLLVGQPEVQSLYPIWSTTNRLILPKDDQLYVPSTDEVEEIFRGYRSENSSISTSSSGNVISLQLSGTAEPQDLADELAGLIESVMNTINQNFQSSIELGGESLTRGRDFFQDERDRILDEIRSWLDGRIASLEQRKLELIGRIESLSGSSESGLYGISLAQLQALESELLRLQGERESAFLQTGIGLDLQLSDIDRTLQAFELSIQDYAYLEGLDWQPLLLQHEPRALPNPVGPSRSMNIIIAGILGLFLGLLLAFFLHFVQTPPTVSPAVD